MVTTYNAIVAQCPPIPGLGPHDMHSISNDRFSFLLLCQPTFISYIAHCKLPEDQQCTWPNRARFTEDDMEALARKLADYPICESVVVRGAVAYPHKSPTDLVRRRRSRSLVLWLDGYGRRRNS
jgi:hypothetical protein